VLTLGQTFKLHLHVTETRDATTHTTSEQFSQVHIDTTVHEIKNHSQLQSDSTSHQHSAVIEISSDSFIKKSELQILAALLVLAFILLSINPRNIRIINKLFRGENRVVTPLHYLVNPPLRAPPASHPF